MTKTIFAFGHKARQGKDTLAKFMIEKYHDRFDMERFGFADAVKLESYEGLSFAAHPFWDSSMRRNLFGNIEPPPKFTTRGEILAWSEKNRPILRPLWQYWGTEFRRAQDENYWVKKTMSDITEADIEIAIITDLRFLSEVLAVTRRGGYVIKVSREDYQPDVDQHVSETALDGFTDWDLEVSANSLEELRAQCPNVLSLIL